MSFTRTPGRVGTVPVTRLTAFTRPSLQGPGGAQRGPEIEGGQECPPPPRRAAQGLRSRPWGRSLGSSPLPADRAVAARDSLAELSWVSL